MTSTAPKGQAALARAVNVSRATLHSWFTGRNLPQAVPLVSLLTVLGVSPDKVAALLAWRAELARGTQTRKADGGALGVPPPDAVPLRGDFVGRRWALDRIADWHAGPGTILLVTGEPGGGKTSLVGELTRGMGAAIAAVHYCRQRESETLDAPRVVEHLVRQMIARVPGFLDALRTATAARGDEALDGELRGARTSRLAFQQFIRRPIQLLYGTGTDRLPMIVIDGFDEAVEGGTGRALATMLAHESRIPTPGLKLVLTSRAIPLLDAVDVSERFDLLADEDASGEDVRLYAEERLSEHLGGLACLMARRIAVRSAGNFLYASFIVDELLTRRHPPGDLATLPLPDGLTGLYREYLDREVAADDDTWRRRVRPLLGLLAQARGEGLTPPQLAAVTGLSRSTVDDTLALCAPYLRRDGAAGPVRVYHQSFVDYLKQDGRHYVYPDEAAERLLEWASAHDDDQHATRHLLEYAADAVRVAGPRARPAVHDILGRMSTSYRLLNAKAALDGAEVLARELAHAIETSRCTDEAVLRLAATVGAQERCLRGWSAASPPGRWLQQLRYQALRDRHGDIVRGIDAYLADEPVTLIKVDWSEGGHDVRADEGHGDTVSAVAVRRTDGLIVTGSYDRTIRANRIDGALGGFFRLPGPVQTVAVFDDRWAVGTCATDLVYLWPLNDEDRAYTLRHDDRVMTVRVLSRGLLATGGDDGFVKVWAPGGVRPEQSFLHDGPVSDIADAGDMLVTAANETCAYVWDLRDGTLSAQLEHDAPVRKVAASASSDRVYTAAGDVLSMWDVREPRLLATATLAGEATTLAVHPDGTLYAAVFDTVHRWNGEGVPAVAAVHDEQVTGIDITPDGLALATSSRDRTGRITLLADGKACVVRHRSWLRDIAFRPDGTAVTVSDDRDVSCWEPVTGRRVWGMRGNADQVTALAYTVDGSRLLCGSGDGTLRVRNALDGGLHAALPHSGALLECAESAHGVVTGTAEGAHYWSLDTGASLRTMRHGATVRTVLASPDGRRLATGGDDHRCLVWDPATGEAVAKLTGHTGPVTKLLWTPDARTLITGSADGTARIWAADGAPGRALQHPGRVRGMALTPDGRYLATTCLDGVVRLWDPATGDVRALAGHEAPARALAIDPSGTLMLTGSRDQTVRLWDIATGRLLRTMCHDGWVRSVAFSAGTRYAVTGSDDRTARWWDLASGRELGRLICHNRVNTVVPHPFDPATACLGTSQGEVLVAALVIGRTTSSESV